MNSHKQMPRGILKQFEDNNSFLYYVDLSQQNYSVKKGHAKSINTEDGYYDDETEKYLNVKIENHLYAILSFLSENHGDECIIPSEISKHSFLYLYSLIARSPDYMDDLPQSLRDKKIKTIIEKAEEKAFLEDTHQMSFIINNTDYPFILPNGGIIGIGKDLVCPLSPKYALYFYNSDECRFGEINNPAAVRDINLKGFDSEYRNNYRCVVCNNREYLSDLLTEWENSVLL